MKKLLLSIFCLFSVYILNAQKPGENIFKNDIVHEIKIKFERSDFWRTLIQNYESTPHGQKVPYIMADVVIDGKLIDSIGVRLKGFTSYAQMSNKKPIKLDFNEYVKGKTYDGLKKLNLNNGTGDAAMQRDVLCYDLLRNTGVNAPRTSFSKVYLNDVYWGLYQNIEQVDKTFIKENFSNSGGNLFKNKDWNNFEWKGAEPDSLHPPYEIKTNEENADWSGLLNLVDVLNNSTDEEFEEEIQKIFNVDLYLKTLAVDVATNNWDSNLQHGRNWYMYEDTVTGIFHWIPWDYNFALGGILTFGGPQDTCSFFPRFLADTDGSTTVQFHDRSFVSSRVDYLWDFGDGGSATIRNPIHNYSISGSYNVCLTVSKSSSCFERFCKRIDTSFNPEECESQKNGSCPHPANESFQQIIEWFPACCDSWTQNCEDIYTQISGNRRDDFSIDQRGSDRILIDRLLQVDEFNRKYYEYFCELLNTSMTEDYLFDILDKNHTLISADIATDPNFLFTVKDFKDDIGANGDSLGLKSYLSNRINELQIDLDTLFSCPEVTEIAWHDIVINEFVASNDSASGISDPSGKYEDWIEIYNNTDVQIDLSNIYMSDEFSDFKQWQFPENTTIEANGYLIVWADKDEDEQGIHADFKLSKAGEQLVISNSDGSIIDSLTFGEQTANIAFARRPNGTGDFVFQNSTFNHSNDILRNSDLNNQLALSIFPNPSSGQLKVNIHNKLSKYYQIYVLSLTGKLLLSDNYYSPDLQLDVNNLLDGMYILQVEDDKANMGRYKFLIAR